MHLPRYTGLRGIASSWVLLSHVILFAGVTLTAGLYLVMRSYIAVEIFFGLSVFLLFRSLDRNPDKQRYFLRRIARIWPLYFGVCGLSFLLFDRDVLTLTENVTFIGVYLPGALVGPYWILWSLQIEEVMYLTFPWIHSLSSDRQLLVASIFVGVSVGTASLWALPSAWKNPLVDYVVVNVHQLPLVWLGAYGAGIMAYHGASLNIWLAGALAGISSFPEVPFVLTVIVSLPLVVALLSTPPTWAGKRAATVVGENSYSIYATQVLWFEAFGWIGALGTLLTSPLIEALTNTRRPVSSWWRPWRF